MLLMEFGWPSSRLLFLRSDVPRLTALNMTFIVTVFWGDIALPFAFDTFPALPAFPSQVSLSHVDVATARRRKLNGN